MLPPQGLQYSFLKRLSLECSVLNKCKSLWGKKQTFVFMQITGTQIFVSAVLHIFNFEAKTKFKSKFKSLHHPNTA